MVISTTARSLLHFVAHPTFPPCCHQDFFARLCQTPWSLKIDCFLPLVVPWFHWFHWLNHMLIPIINYFDFLEICDYILIPYRYSWIIYVKLISVMSEIVLLPTLKLMPVSPFSLIQVSVWSHMVPQRPPIANT